MSKLTDANGEQQETQHWIDTAADCNYLNPDQADKLNSELSEIGRMLNGMVEKSSLFCGNYPYTVRESSGEYFVNKNEN